jgi:polar amino acid transport system substrate-binding protein
MKYFTKTLLAGLAAIALNTTAAFADLKMGVAAEPYPPFTSKNAAGAWEGWEVDFMNAVCAEIKETCTIEEVAWDGIIPALSAKKFDAIMSSMSITAERQKTISFSSMYYNSAPVILGPKNGNMEFAPEKLSGKTIGVQVSTIHADYLAKYYVPKGAVIKTYATQDEVNADLVAGRVDFILADGVTLDSFLASDQGKACCELKGAPPYDVAIFGEGVGFGIRQEDAALRDKLSGGIKALAARGFFEELTAKHNLTGKLLLPTK